MFYDFTSSMKSLSMLKAFFPSLFKIQATKQVKFIDLFQSFLSYISGNTVAPAENTNKSLIRFK